MTDSLNSDDQDRHDSRRAGTQIHEVAKSLTDGAKVLMNEDGSIETASLLDEDGSGQPNLGAILIALLAIMVSVSTLFTSLSKKESGALEKIAKLQGEIHLIEERLGKAESLAEGDRKDRARMELDRMFATVKGISNIAEGETKSVITKIKEELGAFLGGAKASSHAKWGYSGANGPKHWGELSDAYRACSEGKNQSPINLSRMIESNIGNIQFAYSGAPLNVTNNGHTINMDYSPGSFIVANGVRYDLKQFHFHTPSENQINGVSFPMEGHLVHSDDRGNLAVVSVLFYSGRANRVINQVWKQMSAEVNSTIRAPGETVNALDLLPTDRSYYSFSGSLTTPPCTEGVLWMVMKDPVEISDEQVTHLHSILHHDNNRPVQPLYSRVILRN